MRSRVVDVASSPTRFADNALGKEDLNRASDLGLEVTRRAQAGYSLLTLGAMDYQRKLLEIAQRNVNAAFEYAQYLTDARSVSEIAEISNRYARQQCSMCTEHAREVAAGFQQLTGDVVRQFSGMANTFSKVRD
jgi:hypothetical protein